MLKEYFLSLTTPCSPKAKKLGYVREAIATWQRYARCQQAWEPHLSRSKDFILEAAALCSFRRTALVLGAGQCADIPLEDLAEQFDKVLLVDMVFPKQIRRRAASLGVECIEADITEIVTYVAETNSSPLPVPVPSLFLEDETIDFVVSANILSQLSLLPRAWLEKHGGLHEDALMDVCQGLVGAHLHYLTRFNAQIVLLTDRSYQTRNKEGLVVSEKGALHGVALPKSSRTEWEWHIAPPPELHPDYGRVHIVVAQTWQAEGAAYDDVAA